MKSISMLNKQNGMSIVELLVAIAISALLLAGTVSIFINNKQTYEISDDLSRMQENARFAMNFISNDVRMAGYFGCASQAFPINTLDTIVAGSGVLLDTSYFIEGLDDADLAGANGFRPSDNGIVPVSTVAPTGMSANTDAITVRFLSGQRFPLTAAMASASDNITIAANSGLQVGDIIGVADCSGSDLIQITNANTNTSGVISHAASGTPGNTSANLSRPYTSDENAAVSRLVTVRYFIARGSYGGPSLWRASLDNTGGTVSETSEELVPGIENMQILYGMDTDTDGIPDDYDNAANITTLAEWDQVISVRIGLLARTIDTYGEIDDNRNYHLFTGATGCTVNNNTENDGCVDPADSPIRRRVFTSTIVMRNL